MSEEEVTKEEQERHQALCEKIQEVCHGSSYDEALQALTSVMAQFCTEVDNEAELCLTVCEDLIAEFRYLMEHRPSETIITLPDQN